MSEDHEIFCISCQASKKRTPNVTVNMAKDYYFCSKIKKYFGLCSNHIKFYDTQIVNEVYIKISREEYLRRENLRAFI